MKLITWNVNSLKVRLPQVLNYLEKQQPDILCLQELKIEEKVFPFEELLEKGYSAIVSAQKQYNGVAIISKHPMTEVLNILGTDEEKRFLATTINGFRIVNIYAPNGQSLESEKYPYKLTWYQTLTNLLETEVVKYPKYIVAGDFNIAPTDLDVHNPRVWKDTVMTSIPERQCLKNILKLGFADSFRNFPQTAKSFSWWSYGRDFKYNKGLRIDQILVSSQISCLNCDIDTEPRKDERPSDHAPVILEFQ